MGKFKGGANGPSRKEFRKAHKQAAKEKKQLRHATKRNTGTDQKSVGTPSEKQTPLAAVHRGKQKQALKNVKPGSGGGAAVRRKRWRPEEIDPMIAAEDAELKRLERLLGISGPNAKKKRAKLDREIEVEDGLGEEFGAFLSDLDRLSQVVDGRGSGSSDDGRGMEADWDFHKNVPDDASSDGSNDPGQFDEGVGSEDQVEEDEGDGDGDTSPAIHGEGRDVLESFLDSDHDFYESEMDEDGEETPDEAAGVNHAGLPRDRSQVDDTHDEDIDDLDGDGNEDSLESGDEEEQPRAYKTRDHDGQDDDDQDDDYGYNKDRGTRAPSGGDDVDAEEESEEFRRHTYRPKPGQDIYGRTIGVEDGGAAPAKYVPPHLRAAASKAAVSEGQVKAAAPKMGMFGTTAEREKVQRVINGIMNRLSEGTLEPVTARLREVYRGHSTTEANEALWRATKAVCVHDKHVMTTLIPSFAAVIAALNISLGADVGGFFLETIARELDAEALAVGVAPRAGRRGTGSNLILLLAYLYNYGVAHCTLIYDIIGILVDEFGPNEMELLLLLLRHSGYQLRSDDSQALKAIVAFVQQKADTAADIAAADTNNVESSTTAVAADGANGNDSLGETRRWKAAFGSGIPSSNSDNGRFTAEGSSVAEAADASSSRVGGSRARYILDTILELQGNKRNRIQEQGQETGRRVRKWLGSVKAAKGGVGGGGHGSGDASLRVSWAELVSTENRGRWWRVGAAWAGRGSPGADSNGRGQGMDKSASGKKIGGSNSGDKVGVHWPDLTAEGGGKSESGKMKDDGEVGLLDLAARQRMNTNVRRSVFVTIVGSSDCEDALEKILRLNLKGAQEREIARVIVECCSQEGSYNPFYAHLAERVCDRQPKLRFTFQVAFWDALKTLDEGAARRAGSLARLMAHLVVKKQMSLTVLKTIEIPELSPSGLLLMRIFFHEVIAAGDDAAFMEVFRRLARPPGAAEGGGHSAARDNTLVFLRGHLGPAPASWERERRKAFRKRVKGACRLIEAIVTAEELG